MASTRTKKPRKIFIDSSVLIAAAISPTGAGRKIINLGFAKRLDLYVSTDVLEETERNLRLKAPEALDLFFSFRESLSAKVIEPTRRQVLRVAKIIEAKDTPIVAGAIRVKADFLVSYDRKHILQYKKEIKTQFNIKVATPDEVIR